MAGLIGAFACFAVLASALFILLTGQKEGNIPVQALAGALVITVSIVSHRMLKL